MKEVRLIGRGGQGVVMAAEILSQALALESKYVAAFPSFGVERRGAPVFASLRFNGQNIREITQVYHPDCVIVFDRKQSRTLGDGLKGIKSDGIVILNLPDKDPPPGLLESVAAVVLIDANTIALKEIGRSISNTCMLGTFAKATEWVKLDSVTDSLGKYFSEKILQNNLNAAVKGYEKMRIFHS